MFLSHDTYDISMWFSYARKQEVVMFSKKFVGEPKEYYQKLQHIW